MKPLLYADGKDVGADVLLNAGDFLVIGRVAKAKVGFQEEGHIVRHGDVVTGKVLNSRSLSLLVAWFCSSPG